MFSFSELGDKLVMIRKSGLVTGVTEKGFSIHSAR